MVTIDNCPRCGTEYKSVDSEYCSSCGARRPMAEKNCCTSAMCENHDRDLGDDLYCDICGSPTVIGRKINDLI